MHLKGLINWIPRQAGAVSGSSKLIFFIGLNEWDSTWSDDWFNQNLYTYSNWILLILLVISDRNMFEIAVQICGNTSWFLLVTGRRGNKTPTCEKWPEGDSKVLSELLWKEYQRRDIHQETVSIVHIWSHLPCHPLYIINHLITLFPFLILKRGDSKDLSNCNCVIWCPEVGGTVS